LPVTFIESVLVFVAGISAGTINAIVGSGTLVTFPVLVGFGIPPVVATMSNAIGLVPGNVSGTWGYRRELRGQWSQLRWQIPGSLAGSLVGAWLLLHLPARAFQSIVPVLLVLALVLVVTQPWITRRVRAKGLTDNPEQELPPLSPTRLAALVAATFVTGIYGGYFAAAQGVLLVGLMGVIVHESLQRINAAKNLLTLLVNTVSAGTYIVVAYDRIHWLAVGLIAAGSLIGGFAGAGVGRRLRPPVLRGFIVALGIYAIWRILTLD
jgi:uncharacterized protein